MAQSFKETAHLNEDREKINETLKRVYGDDFRVQKGSYAYRDGKLVEISPEESKKATKHPTAGLCGEYGMSEVVSRGGIGPGIEIKEQPRYSCPLCNYDQNRHEDFCENCITKL